LKGFGGFLSKIRHFARSRTIVQKIERERPFSFNVDRRWGTGDHFWLEGGELGLRVSGDGAERVGGIRGGGCVWLPGTRWDFFRDREAVIRYVVRLFPIP
jgi:hypothetical protein